MPMADKLASLLPRVGESHPVDDVIESGFQNLQEIVAGHTAPALRLHEMLVELAFHDAVEPAHLLLLAKLESKLRRSPRPALPVLAGRKILGGLALHDRALRPIAAGTLQIYLHALSPAQPPDAPRRARHR